jgi:N-glycosylase/DNA lyase
MDVDLKATLCGGQCFSWKEKDGVYTAVMDGRLVSIRNTDDIRREGLSRYFDLDYPYGEARAYLASLSSVMKQAVSYAPGLHILNQDEWCATISFILSQNNNIKRITSLYDTLCRTYGTSVGDGSYAFPTQEQLSHATEAELRELHFGYRSVYLVSAAEEWKPIPRDLPTEEARKELLRRKGIGPKVADCILLFGLHRMDTFPMDTWMKKVMSRFFPGKDGSLFAPYEGLAQQYLFQAMREGGLSC